MQPSRRAVAKGVAWTVPVVSIAAVVPTAAASTPQDVVVTSSCYGLNIFGVGFSFPQFTISAVSAPIQAGSTFTFSGNGIANLTLGGIGSAFSLNILNPNSATITLSQAIPAGSSLTIQVTGLASAQALSTYTVAVKTIIGNANTNPGNDSASQTLLGVSLFGIIGGYCGTSASANSAKIAADKAKVAAMTPAQQTQLKQALGNH